MQLYTHTHWHYLLDKNNGITLIALVITIIILIILACISIGAVVGDNGILNKATEAIDATGIAGAKEAFELAVDAGYADYYYIETYNATHLTVAEYITIGTIRASLGNSYQYCSKYGSAENTEDDDKTLEDMLVYGTNTGVVYLSEKGAEDGQTIYKVTCEINDDGDIINVQVEKVEPVEYVPGGDEEIEVENEDGNYSVTRIITFTKSETDWTNEDVTVTIQVNGEYADLVADGTYTLQYTTGNALNEDDWLEYTDEVTFEENGIIFARLYNGTNGGDFATATVKNIDKTAPTITSVSIGTTNLIVIAEDEDSGVVGYYVGTSSTEPSKKSFVDCSDESGDGLELVQIMIDGLEAETTYYIWILDYAGNISEAKEVTTNEVTEVPDLTSDNVEFTQSEDDWTNDDVIIYVDITDPDLEEDIEDGTYIIEYSTDGGETWEEYDPETGIPVDENTEIEVRLSDGENTGGEVTYEVDNIDKTAPTVDIEVTDTSTNSITVEVTAEDLGDDGTSDSGSGIISYEFQISTDGENWETVETIETSEETYTYTYEDLTDDTTYYVRVVVTDEAGNSTTSEAEEVTLGEVPGGNDPSGNKDDDGIDIPTVTFNYSETDWTNEDVTVTVVVNGETAELVEDGTYIVEYSTDATNWTEYTDGVVFSKNGSIYARLNDGTNAGDYATGTVTNIDKISPEVTVLRTFPERITFDGEDTESDDYGLSGIVGYYISTSSSTLTSSSSWIDCSDAAQYNLGTAITNGGYDTVRLKEVDLTSEKKYYIWVIDEAGNISEAVNTTTLAYTAIDTDGDKSSYIGYYADIDDDLSIEGVIYADLAYDASGKFGNLGNWAYSSVSSSSLNEYYICDYNGDFTEDDVDFGENYIVTSILTSFEDRFYVMTLDDLTTSYSTFYWYYNAYGSLPASKVVDVSSNDFGTGLENTKFWLDAYANETYGDQYSARELWSLTSYVGTNVGSTDSVWFIPSKSEWSAFRMCL